MCLPRAPMTRSTVLTRRPWSKRERDNRTPHLVYIARSAERHRESPNVARRHVRIQEMNRNRTPHEIRARLASHHTQIP